MDVLSPIDEHATVGAERMPSAEISERFLAAIEPHRRILYKVARAYGRSVYWMSKHYGQRLLRYPWIARLNEDLAGRNLSEARARLAELARFQREDG